MQKFILLVFIALIVIIELIRNLDKWATKLQQIYIRTAKEKNMSSEKWENPLIKTLFKTGIVLVTFVIILIIYSLFFGPIVF